MVNSRSPSTAARRSGWPPRSTWTTSSAGPPTSTAIRRSSGTSRQAAGSTRRSTATAAAELPRVRMVQDREPHPAAQLDRRRQLVPVRPGDGLRARRLPEARHERRAHRDRQRRVPGNSYLTARIWAYEKPPAGDQSCAMPAGFSFGSSASPLLSADGDVVFTPVPAQAADGGPNAYVAAADYPGVRSREPDHGLARDRWGRRQLAEPRQRRQRQRRELRLPAERATAGQQPGARLDRHAPHPGGGHVRPGRRGREGRLDPAHRRRPRRALGRALVRARPEPLQRDHLPRRRAQAGRHRLGRHPLRLQRARSRRPATARTR